MLCFEQWKNSEGVVNHEVTQYPTYVWFDDFVGVNNPSWKSQVKNLQGATTSADGSKTVFNSEPYISSFIQLSNGISYAMIGSPYHVLPSLPIPGADINVVSRVVDSAYSQFLTKAKNQLSSFESGQDLGELKETIESILHPMKSLREHVLSYFSSVKKLKSRYKKASSLRKALADSYLEWTFGWKPLSADIADGIVGLGSTRLPNAPIDSFAKEKYDHTESEVDSSALTSGGFVAHLTTTGVFSIRLKGLVNVYYTGLQPSLRQELRLLPEDFLPTAWDLLPYSFVVDYFTNVGDIINAVSFPRAAMRWCQQSSHDERHASQRYVDAVDHSSVGSRSLSSSNLEVSTTAFSRRSVNPADHIPEVHFSLPLSMKPWENIAALIAGRTKPLIPLW